MQGWVTRASGSIALKVDVTSTGVSPRRGSYVGATDSYNALASTAQACVTQSKVGRRRDDRAVSHWCFFRAPPGYLNNH